MVSLKKLAIDDAVENRRHASAEMAANWQVPEHCSITSKRRLLIYPIARRLAALTFFYFHRGYERATAMLKASTTNKLTSTSIASQARR